MEDIGLLIFAIVVLFCILCASIGYLLYICGVTQTIEVGAGAPVIGEVTVAYKFRTGPYKECGELFTETCKFAPYCKQIGIYYDDPKVIPKEKLRYCVGAILSEEGVKVEKELVNTMTAEGFKVIKLPKVSHCVKTSFPYINVMSIMIAVWRVYPKLSQYIKEHALCAYPMIEIYEKNFIQFMAPLSQQDDFFVPEANENIPEEYSENQADISRDESMLDWTRDDVSRSSRDSSASSFSRSYVSSRYETDDLTDDESEDEGGPSVQDDEVSSTVDVRASKACTNLLEDAEKQAKLVTEEEILMTDDKDDLKLSADDSLNINNDSGVCSGRTSASPNQSTIMGHVSTAAEADGNESSSSFEEIHVDSVKEAMSLSTEA